METTFHDLELETKPDFIRCMKRVYAWYDGELLDRVPVRFAGYDEAFHSDNDDVRWPTQEERWFDTEYRVENFLSAVRGKLFLGETFPVFWPNLGPNVFAAMLGGAMEFGEDTSWLRPFVSGADDLETIALDKDGKYYRKLVEMTEYALERCKNQCMVGYTDIHSGLDCVDAMCGTSNVCIGLYDHPDFIKKCMEKTTAPFFEVMDAFHSMLRKEKQLSVGWLNIPSYETMHIPSCDLGAMLSREAFDEFALPIIKKEVKSFRHNIFHIDGPGVARHIDSLLELKEVCGFQWVQGVGVDRPIMQWTGFIKKLQEHKKGVVVDLRLHELETFMNEMSPEGIYLCIDEKDEEIQREILGKLLRWK